MSGTLILRAHELPLDLLANELAMKIHTPSEIAEIFSTDVPTIYELLQRPEYYKLCKQRRAAWLASSNTAQRAKLLSQTTWCETIPHVYGIATDPKAPLQARVDAAKLIERAAAEPPSQQAQGATGRGFQVIINLGGEQTVAVSLPSGSPVIDQTQEQEDYEPEYSE